MSQNWRDWPVLKYSTPDILERLAETFEYFNDDVLINTYGKTGTTLTQEIVYCLLHGIKAAKETELWRRSPFLEFGLPDPLNGPLQIDVAASLLRPRVLKTHLPAPFHLRHLKQEETSTTGGPKVIVVMRNPKDTMVSAFYHFNGISFHADELPRNFSEMWKKLAFESTTDGSSLFNFFDFTQSWWALRDHPRVRVYFFEDMVTKKAEVVRSIAEFLEVEVTEEQVQAIVEHTSFDAMRGNANVNPSAQEAMQANFLNGFNFIRKGKIGDWKNHFTVADNELMDRLIAEKLDPTGIKFVYE